MFFEIQQFPAGFLIIKKPDMKAIAFFDYPDDANNLCDLLNGLESDRRDASDYAAELEENVLDLFEEFSDVVRRLESY